MASDSSYLVRLAAWLAQALGDSAPLFEDFATDDLGLELPPAVAQAPAVTTALQQAAAGAHRVGDAGDRLETAAGGGDDAAILAGLLALGTQLATFYVALDALATAVTASVTPATVPDPAARAAAQDFASSLAKRISDYAIASAITDRTPQFAFVLRLLGLLDWRALPAPPAGDLGRDHVRRTLELHRVKDLIHDPATHYRQALGWGDASFDPGDIFRLARDFFHQEADVDAGVRAGDPFLRIGAFLIRRDRGVSPPALMLALVAAFDADRNARVELNDEWGAGISSSLRMVGTVSGRVTPPLSLSLQPAGVDIGGSLRAQFERNESARPFQVLGGAGVLSVTATNAALGVGFDVHWDAGMHQASFDPLVYADIEGLTVKLGTADADSFIGSLLAGGAIDGQVDLGLEWRASNGLTVKASGGVEIALPVHRRLGPAELQTLYLSLRILPQGTLSLETSAALRGTLGPLTAVVDRIGSTLAVRFAEGADGRFGAFDVALRFKAPNGVGLSVDAIAVKGGGFLRFDPDRGEYSGALELVFSDALTLRAIGLITTRNPDGSPGFSLLILITADFGTGIQLGFGFTLLAVGGLLGLNRTMRLQALVDGVRSGAIESVMFAHDVVANAPRIISDLRTFFPPQDGRFLIGPMAKLGWGTPALVTLSVGVVIEIPGNVAILGVLRVALPSDDAALIVIQVNFLGVIEFDRERIYFFAALFDSRVLYLTIEGEMALLAAFGDDANFVLSVGGFHPRFSPPPLPVPTPRRIAIDILNTPSARLRVEGYFAVTTNTAQFGAHAEAYFGLSAFEVQGDLAFDALLQFSPLHFVIDISCSFALKAFGIGVFSVKVHFTLEGPAPWRARGTGSISLLFFDIAADFDVTWGEERRVELPPIAVMPLLAGELGKQSNWQARLPAGNTLRVALRHLEPDPAALVLHPVGTLRVSQKAVPLDLSIDKVGNQRPSDAHRFSLAVSSDGLAKRGDVDEQFAPAQFPDFDDAAKVALPAFEPDHGGIELSVAGDQLDSGAMVKRVDRYELITIDTAGRRFVRHFHVFTGVLFEHLLAGASIARSPVSHATRTRSVPFGDKVAVTGESFVVATQAGNAAVASFASASMARDHLERQIARDPSLAGSLHVIPAFEAAA